MSYGGGGGGSGKISTDGDVALNNPADGQLLTYSTGIGKWQNQSDANPLVENVHTVAASGSSQTLPDVTTATIHNLTLTADCTLTFPTAGAGKSFLLSLVQDNTGGRTVSWPLSIKWQSATMPTLSVTAAATDVFSFVCVNGTNWLGLPVGQGF